MRSFLAVLLLAPLAAPAMADYYVAGDFNGWNAAGNLMTQVGADKWSVSLPDVAGRHEFKVTIGDWAQAWPGDNMKADFGGGGGGGFTINFYPGAQADGWNPPENRVGYDDLELNGWEVMGSFNGWSAPIPLARLGGGLYQGDYFVPTAGDYWFKFRWAGDWDIALGSDFSNYGHDIQVNVPTDNTTVRFSLDLPNGRWKCDVPEPATLAAMLLGLALLRRR
jgi:hypothetical protein